jgi:hypothetical protein
MKYVIDSTQRKDRWKNAFPDDVQIVSELDVASIAITRDDIVFAHTTTDFRLSPTGDGNDPISLFRRIIPITQEDAPLFFMYSGNGIGTAYEKPWINLCVTTALPGFPTDRVKVIRDVINQTGSAQDLAAIINDCLTQWRYEQQNIGDSVGNDAGMTTSNAPASAGYSARDPSAFLALRLLCEAWEQVSLKKELTVCDITIHAPVSIWQWLGLFGITKPHDETKKADAQMIDQVAGMIGSGDIRTKAKAVLEAANGTGDLTEAIGEFLKPKQVNSAPQ